MIVRPEDQSRWRPWLLPGERLLWAGRPKRGLAIAWSDFTSAPAVPLIAALVLADNYRLIRDGLSSPGDPERLVIALGALHLLFGRFLVDILMRRRIFYAVTEHRVLILRTGPFSALKSIDVEYLPMLDLEEQAGGRGNLLFDPDEGKSGWTAAAPGFLAPSLQPGIRFFRIDDARAVYNLVRGQAERRRREHRAELPPERAFIG